MVETYFLERLANIGFRRKSPGYQLISCIQIIQYAHHYIITPLHFPLLRFDLPINRISAIIHRMERK